MVGEKSDGLFASFTVKGKSVEYQSRIGEMRIGVHKRRRMGKHN